MNGETAGAAPAWRRGPDEDKGGGECRRAADGETAHVHGHKGTRSGGGQHTANVAYRRPPTGSIR